MLQHPTFTYIDYFICMQYQVVEVLLFGRWVTCSFRMENYIRQIHTHTHTYSIYIDTHTHTLKTPNMTKLNLICMILLAMGRNPNNISNEMENTSKQLFKFLKEFYLYLFISNIFMSSWFSIFHSAFISVLNMYQSLKWFKCSSFWYGIYK